MKIVTTTSVFPPEYPAEDAARRLASLGFEGLDLAIDYCHADPHSPFHTERAEEWARALGEGAREWGAPFTHAHGVGDFGLCSDTARKNYAVAAAVGASALVIHPITQRSDRSVIDGEDEFLTVNLAALRPHLAWAEKYGVTLLTENIPWSAAKHFYVSDRLVREANHPLFGWCYDTGHGQLAYEEPKSLIGLIPPRSLHLQDNHRGIWNDEHLMPGDGDLDFTAVWDALTEIGYGGDYVLEAHHQTLAAEDEARDPILGEILRRSRAVRDTLCRGERVLSVK